MTYNINNLIRIFGSRAKSQEIVLLMAGLKPLVRQGFYENELNLVEKFCKLANICLVKSKFKVLLTDSDKNYSNKGLRIPIEDKKQGMFFIYLSMKKELAEQAADYEENNDHEKLGLILGYPECCVHFFCKNFSDKKPDLELKPENPYTNLTKRAEDYVLLSHFPCKSSCERSIEMGKEYFDVMKKLDERYSEVLIKELSKY